MIEPKLFSQFLVDNFPYLIVGISHSFEPAHNVVYYFIFLSPEEAISLFLGFVFVLMQLVLVHSS